MKYTSKISVRSKDTYCVHFPKEKVIDGEYPLGTKVEVLIQKEKIVLNNEKNKVFRGKNEVCSGCYI